MRAVEKFLPSISDKTVIPMGVAMVLAYIIIWAVHEGDKIEYMAEKARQVEINQSEYTRDMSAIDKRLIHIESVLSRVKNGK